MFIMGVNITLSVESLMKRNTPRREIAYKVVRRTLILFALGLTIININSKTFSSIYTETKKLAISSCIVEVLDALILAHDLVLAHGFPTGG